MPALSHNSGVTKKTKAFFDLCNQYFTVHVSAIHGTVIGKQLRKKKIDGKLNCNDRYLYLIGHVFQRLSLYKINIPLIMFVSH